jgi:hypothetical protein
MARLTEHNEFWKEHRGAKVTLSGLKHRLEVDIHEAYYPYPHTCIYVSAVPLDKTSKEYLSTKRYLGDDWFTDVLESDPEVIVDVMKQLEDAKRKAQLAERG